MPFLTPFLVGRVPLLKYVLQKKYNKKTIRYQLVLSSPLEDLKALRPFPFGFQSLVSWFREARHLATHTVLSASAAVVWIQEWTEGLPNSVRKCFNNTGAARPTGWRFRVATNWVAPFACRLGGCFGKKATRHLVDKVPQCPFTLFFGEGSYTKIKNRKRVPFF